MKEFRLGKEGRNLWILDSVSESDALSGIESFFKNLNFTFSESDRDDTEYLKHLACNFEPEDYQNHPVLSIFIENVRDALITKGYKVGEIQRVYANFILYGDFQYAHTDGEVWTGLYFLNSKWTDDWGGEFQAYDDTTEGLSLNITPTPGRLVIFDGEIPHRGGVPSRQCTEPRLTLVVKFWKL